jgi:hypothetical protein
VGLQICHSRAHVSDYLKRKLEVMVWLCSLLGVQKKDGS